MSVKISSLNTASTINSGDDITIAGNNPLYFSDWGGGWYMQDGTWMRNYDRSLWIGTGVYGTDGGLTIGYGGGAPPSAGAIIAGSVGIGTNSPSNKLDVNGSVRFTNGTNPYLALYDGTSTSYLQVSGGNLDVRVGGANAITFNANSAERMRISAGGSLLLGDTVIPSESNWKGTAVFGINGYDKVITGYLTSTSTGAFVGGHNSALSAWADLNLAGTNLIFRISQVETMRIASTGNVGIGTASPQKTLDVVTGANTFVTVGAATTMGVGQWAGIHFGYREDNALYRKSAIVFERTDNAGGGGNAAGKIYILNGPGIGAGSATLADAKLTIDEYGKVGIGTTTPLNKLVAVNDGVYNDENSYAIAAAAASDSAYKMMIGYDWVNDVGIIAAVHTAVSWKHISIPQGNLLIGTTTNAGFKLDVNGTARFSGDITISGQRIKELTSTNKGIYIGNWGGAGYWGLGSTATSHELKLDQVNQSTGAWEGATDVNLYLGSNRLVLHSLNFNSYAPTLTGTGASGTWGISVTGSAATAGTSTYASILTTTNQGKTGSTGLTTVSSTTEWSNYPIGYSAMFLAGQTATGAPSGNYGFFIKIANRDAGGGWGGIWTDYSGGDTYVGNTTISSSYANWYKLLSSNNYGSYALPLTGGNLTGLVISTANIEASAFRTDGNFELTSGLTGLKSNFYDTRFYASNTSYWNITSSAGATTGALLFRQGYESTVKGYVYWDSAGFGLLNNVGNWAVRTNNGGSMGGSLYGSWVVRSMTVDSGLLSFYTSAGVTKGSVAWDDQGFGLHNNQNDYSLICNQGSSFGGLLIGTWSSTGDFNIAGANLSINSNASYINANITYSSSSDPYGEHWYSGMDYDSTADESYYYIYYADGNQFRIYPDGTIYVNGGAFSQYSAVGNYISVGAYGLYSNTYSAYFRRNDSSSYAPWELVGVKNGYTGISYSTSNQPHIMFNTSNGNGGLYYQTNSRWILYYDYSNNSLGVGGTTTDSTYKLYVNGNVRVVGTFNLSTLITNGAVYSIGGGLTNTNPSDLRLKEDINPLQYGLKEVMGLNPVTYKWKDGSNGGQRSTGLIAQDVQEVMPEYVKNISEDSDFLGLDSYAINIVLINAIKELKAEIEILKNK